MKNAISVSELISPEKIFIDTIYCESRSFVYSMWLLCCGLLSYYIYSHTGRSLDSNIRTAVAFGLLIVIVHFIRHTLNKPRNFLAPDLMYVVFYTAFHFGYLGLWLFNIVPESPKVFYSIGQYPLVMLIVNLGMISFLLGYEISGPKNLVPASIRLIPNASWTLVGALLMMIALGVHVFYLFYAGIDTWMAYGYQVYIHMEDYVSYPNMWRIQLHLFSIGFSIYIVSCVLQHGKLFNGKFGVFLFSIYMALLFLEGGRTQLVTLGLILLLVRHYLIKPLSFKMLALICFCGLTAFVFIKLFRNVAGFNVSRAIEEITYAGQSDLTHWYDSFVEMGGSVSTINLTTMLVPGTSGFWHGRSYLQSIAHVFPYLQSVLMPVLGASPSTWLTLTHFGMFAAGTGYSIAAEGYLNFGIPGVIVQMFLIGIILRRIYVWFARTLTMTSTLFFIISFGLFMITVRNHTNLLVSPLVRLLVLMWLLKSIFKETVIAMHQKQQPKD